MKHDCGGDAGSAPEAAFRAETSNCCPACLVLTAGPVAEQSVSPVTLGRPQVVHAVGAALAPALLSFESASSQRDRAPPSL